jgi:hypothetical protein
MTALNSGAAIAASVLGTTVSKTHTIATETRDLFTIAGGLVLVTSIVGKVTTALTVANTVKLLANPTTGTSSDLCAATDLGTTDTPAGNLLGITGAPAESIFTGIGALGRMPVTEASGSPATGTLTGGAQGIYLTTGILQAVVTGTSPDGVIVWYVSYVPLDSGATVVAA